MSESSTTTGAASGPAAIEFTDAQRRSFRAGLLSWYRRHRRELPWRGVEDPYAVWVSEVMLQQTQVATVIDYYRRWLERFPSVEDLAQAEVDDVLEMWAGLGYYRRARFLYESAQMIVDELGGELPKTARDLQKLKGVGPYTAGAVASIAFGERTPVVDGNVERVLSRLCAISGDPKSTPNQKLYWRLAGELVDPEAPGDFNQAMMELGATVCTPQNPTCMLCPLREYCEGFASGEPSAYPDTARRARQRAMTVHTAVIVRRGVDESAFLMVKRPSDGLLAGLWEFPTVEADDAGAADDPLDAYLSDDLGARAACDAEPVELGEFVHHFSHIRMTIHAQVREVGADDAERGLEHSLDRPVEWVGRAGLDELAMSAAMQKVLLLFDERPLDRGPR